MHNTNHIPSLNWKYTILCLMTSEILVICALIQSINLFLTEHMDPE